MRFYTLVLLILFFTSALLTSCSERKPSTITIATAANMQFAMKALGKNFTHETGIECELVISSSGKLTAQIIEGAPYDIFAAANMIYPEQVHRSGLSVHKPKVYALGKLVLWTMIDSLEPSISLVMDKKISHIALANPKTAPYGVAALEVLTHFDLTKQLSSKLVFGESIAQTNQFITSKSAEIGFTSKSVVLSPQMKGKGKWVEINPKLYSPIEQGVILIKNENVKISQFFYNYLFSTEAKKILKDYGYSISH